MGGAAALACIVGLAFLAVAAVRFTEAFIARQQSDLRAIDRLAARVPAGARLITFGSTLALRDRGLEPLELYDLDVEEVEALVARPPVTYLLIPDHGMDDQWADSPPGRNLAALRASPGLREVDHAGAWLLLAVGW
jgi:hypothetical protein